MLSLDGATKVSEGSKRVLGGNGDVRIMSVLNDSSLVIYGHGMPVFSCHTHPILLQHAYSFEWIMIQMQMYHANRHVVIYIWLYLLAAP